MLEGAFSWTRARDCGWILRSLMWRSSLAILLQIGAYWNYHWSSVMGLSRAFWQRDEVAMRRASGGCCLVEHCWPGDRQRLCQVSK